ncbi:spermidine/putrescine ABC transporter ATP-binding protein [Microbacterium faecale]|uniref:ABC-type quaternary amine transporter n=1 Tax=Microbacterium faecale TaxID=1804630 RepID=A0A916Y5E8_9MICO|nr:ABC transporter ATP-binding protein [Microbacterium faecale]GGD31557.1 spermidine/putrescine ABC transporter ATP-binding protein [Microbacterium faecale]
MSSVSFENVSFSYSDAVGAGGLHDVTLHLGESGITAILGASGSGKTTMLRLIAGFIRPSHGTIKLDDRVVAGPRYVPPQKRNLAVVFQSYALWPHLTVAQNVALPLKAKNLGKRERETRILETLEITGLGELADRLPAQLSGGQQQRVALARSIALRPGLILFDEPLSNLDAALRGRLRTQLQELQRSTGIAFVYVTHDRDEAMSLADHLIVLENGSLLCSGEPRALYAAPPTRSAAEILSHWAAELPGVAVEGGKAAGVLLEGTSRTLTLSPRQCPKPLVVGEHVTVLVRNQGLRIAGTPDDQSLEGTVERDEFVDGDVKLWVRLESGHLVTVMDAGSTSGQKGTKVAVAIDDDHVVAYPGDDTTYTPNTASLARV